MSGLTRVAGSQTACPITARISFGGEPRCTPRRMSRHPGVRTQSSSRKTIRSAVDAAAPALRAAAGPRFACLTKRIVRPVGSAPRTTASTPAASGDPSSATITSITSAPWACNTPCSARASRSGRLNVGITIEMSARPVMVVTPIPPPSRVHRRGHHPRHRRGYPQSDPSSYPEPLAPGRLTHAVPATVRPLLIQGQPPPK